MILISKKKAFSIIAIVASISIGLVVSEIAIRILYPGLTDTNLDENGSVLRTDPHLGSVIVPYSPSNDAWGFKNKGVPQKADIITLGDSHTYGIYGTHDDWPSFFSQDSGHDVYNMGMWGYGPAQYAALLPKALSLKPTTVIVALFLGNDVLDAYDSVYHLEGWDAYRNPSFKDTAPISSGSIKQMNIPFRGVRDYLRTHIVLYKLLGNSTRNLREYLGLASPRTIGTENWSTADSDASLRFKAPGISTLFWAGSRVQSVDLSKPEVQEGLVLTRKFLSEMKDESRTSGARIVFALIPSKESVYAPLVSQAGLRNDTYTSLVENEKKIRTDIISWCKTERVTCVDMLPALSAGLEAGKTLYPETWDDHPVVLGYQAYAAIINSAITPP